MAETLMFNIAEQVLGKLSSLAIKEIRLAWGVKNDLAKMTDTLATVQAVLLDAEDKQKKNRALTAWLAQLKRVFYEAKDVLDEFECEALRQQVVSRGSTMGKVRHFFSCCNSTGFRFRMAHKIKKIRGRLDEIAAEKDKFNLTVQESDTRVLHTYRESYSFLDSLSVVGRDNDKEMVVDLVMRANDRDNVSVIPVVGMGGLGKTTLAKMVFNDGRVIEHFDLKMWVCVSDDFDLKNVLAKIIKAGGAHAPCDYSDMNQLHSATGELLDGKRYLLVLDDVWNDDRGKWIELRGFLMGGAHGSRILVTTRSQSVASIMGTSAMFNLEGLPFEDCLSLFKKWAFKEGEEERHQDLLEIGREIVKRCKGVPLAVKTLGSLLYMKTDQRDWLFIRDNEIWQLEQKEDDIMGVLRLSYDQLPSHLKQCFAHCSIYPKDWDFVSLDLIHAWIAHGFIQSTDQNQDLEDIGRKYVDELLSRSFFQESEHMGILFTFKMHDLMHDLALSVAKDEYTSAKFHPQSVSKNFRHASFSSDCELSVGERLNNSLDATTVQSIFVFRTVKNRTISPTFVEMCIKRFKNLRALSLDSCCFEEFPSSIGNLKHLRYLDLRENQLIKTLPNSLCKLQSLQTLGLLGCLELQKLPRDFGNLISLRCLWLTTKERCLPGKVMGRLTSLRVLWIGNCDNLEHLFDDNGNGLQYLTVLRTLVIVSCKNLAALPRGMRYLTALENLVIVNCERLDLMGNEGQEGNPEGIIDGSGLNSLRYLGIAHLPKLESLPQWLLQVAATTLNNINFKECDNFTALPDNLISLQKLKIIKCPRLMFLPEGLTHLTTLKEIHINECPELIKRCQRETGEDWRKISHVHQIYLDGVRI